MILETPFQGINPTMLFRLPGYYDWYRQADTRFGYRVHKMWLQHLAWKNPRRRWVLKVQEHAHHLPELLATYPDAETDGVRQLRSAAIGLAWPVARTVTISAIGVHEDREDSYRRNSLTVVFARRFGPQ